MKTPDTNPLRSPLVAGGLLATTVALLAAACQTVPYTGRKQAVVIPQVGQGMSAATIHPHRGSPNCRWVPTPSALGCIHSARPRRPAAAAATISAVQRREQVPAAIEALVVLCALVISGKGTALPIPPQSRQQVGSGHGVGVD